MSDPITGQPFAVGSYVRVKNSPKIFGEVVSCFKKSYDEDREWEVQFQSMRYEHPLAYWWWQVEAATTDGRKVEPCIHGEGNDWEES